MATEIVHSFIYLAILINDSVTFKPHVECLHEVKNKKQNITRKLSFHFRVILQSSTFILKQKESLVAATSLPVLNDVAL